ncbi:MAG: hypothetical protein ACI90V_001186 [Bacillariaceae sp.]|jgi:hypothetical protein
MTVRRRPPRRKYYYELAENGIIVLNDNGDDDDDDGSDRNQKQRELKEEKQRIDILKERLYRLKKIMLDNSFCIKIDIEHDNIIEELLQKHLVTSEKKYTKAIADIATTTGGGGGGGGPGYVCNVNVEIIDNSLQMKKIDDNIMTMKKKGRRIRSSSASSSSLLSSLSSECYQNL